MLSFETSWIFVRQSQFEQLFVYWYSYMNFKAFLLPVLVRVSCFGQCRINTEHKCRRFVENISIADRRFLMHVLNNFEILYTVHKRSDVNISISVTGTSWDVSFHNKKNYPLFEKSSVLWFKYKFTNDRIVPNLIGIKTNK